MVNGFFEWHERVLPRTYRSGSFCHISRLVSMISFHLLDLYDGQVVGQFVVTNLANDIHSLTSSNSSRYLSILSICARRLSSWSSISRCWSMFSRTTRLLDDLTKHFRSDLLLGITQFYPGLMWLSRWIPSKPMSRAVCATLSVTHGYRRYDLGRR